MLFKTIVRAVHAQVAACVVAHVKYTLNLRQVHVNSRQFTSHPCLLILHSFTLNLHSALAQLVKSRGLSLINLSIVFFTRCAVVPPTARHTLF